MGVPETQEKVLVTPDYSDVVIVWCPDRHDERVSNRTIYLHTFLEICL